MESVWSSRASEDFEAFEKTLKRYFKSHIEKLCNMPTRRHMKLGLPFFVENVTAQARLVYLEDGGFIKIIRCFSTHKEYEKWYNSFR